MTLGEKIRAERERRGWSQTELAEKVGFSQPALRKIEAGLTHNSRYLAKLLRILELPQELAELAGAKALREDRAPQNASASAKKRLAAEVVCRFLLDLLCRDEAHRAMLADPAFRRQVARLLVATATAPLDSDAILNADQAAQQQALVLFHTLGHQESEQ